MRRGVGRAPGAFPSPLMHGVDPRIRRTVSCYPRDRGRRGVDPADTIVRRAQIVAWGVYRCGCFLVSVVWKGPTLYRGREAVLGKDRETTPARGELRLHGFPPFQTREARSFPTEPYRPVTIDPTGHHAPPAPQVMRLGELFKSNATGEKCQHISGFHRLSSPYSRGNSGSRYCRSPVPFP